MSRQQNNIHYINRQTGQIEEEEVFGKSLICFLYGSSLASKVFGRTILHTFAKWPFFAAIYGWFQKKRFSKRKVIPFINHFKIDITEFEKSPQSFSSFNDFFIRKLNAATRPIATSGAVMPADGRYTFFPNISWDTSFDVKDKPFCLKTVLKNEALSELYNGGSLVIARLCPTDCHRFYFPVDCTPGPAKEIKGKLFAVNPIATRDNPWIWGTNRRYLSLLSSPLFGQVAFLEVGATNVGTVIQTYTAGQSYLKGDEKGYFAFGGSALLIFFEKDRIQFDQDLLDDSKKGLEIRCLIGQSLGKPI